MKTFSKILIAWLPVLMCMGLIFYLSSLPADEVRISDTDWIERNLKNGLHACEYLFLWLLQFRAYRLSNLSKKQAIKYAWITIFLFALSDEYHQRFTPGRESSLGDVAFDCLGMGMANCILTYPKSRSMKKLLARLGFAD